MIYSRPFLSTTNRESELTGGLITKSVNSEDVVLIAFFFSGVIGVFFGYYPPRKAAAMNPDDALRYK
jgi:ABC-type antimicrobial peptide transport system permease subunit